MTMQPAPKNEAGEHVCSLMCDACCVIDHKVWTYGMGCWVVVKHCPDCGRPLGFDADGNPVVGPSVKELERAALLLAVGEEALSHPLIVLRVATQRRARRDLDNAVRRMRDDTAPEVYVADE